MFLSQPNNITIVFDLPRLGFLPTPLHLLCLTRVKIESNLIVKCEAKMEGNLKIVVEQKQVKVPVTIFRISGWLDVQSEGQLLETARLAHDEGARFVLIEMSDLNTLTSAGMRAIQKVYQMYTPKNEKIKIAHLKLCNASSQICNVLGITGFLQNIPMYESLEYALDSFGNE
jgi:anti-anti-sigma factor